MKIVALLLCLPTVLSFNILVICSPSSKSHNNLCSAVTDILTERRHNVTFITPFPTGKKSAYREILIDAQELIEEFPSPFKMSNYSFLKMVERGVGIIKNMSNVIIENPNVQRLLNDNREKFDLVILEYFVNENLFGFSIKYNCPLILISTINMVQSVATATGNPLSLATVPNSMTDLPLNMNIWQRLINLFYHIMHFVFERLLFVPMIEAAYERSFPNESKIVKFSDLHQKIAAVISVSHHTIGPVRPLLPNLIEVGGFHIEEPGPLPKELETIINGSNHGIILFSLGSVVKTKDLTPEMRKLFINTFSKFKETILWKFDADIKDLPSNVIVQKWLPQTSILGKANVVKFMPNLVHIQAHPNLKLFISHGGLFSCTEAAHFGAPMLIIPIFSDQKFNARVFTDKGLALTLQYFNMTEGLLEQTMRAMINNSTYKENALKTQKIFLDRPINPRDHIAFLAEHIIKTGGSHLSPPKLPKYSLLLIDVIALILSILISFLMILYCICKICVTRINKSKTDHKLKIN